MNNRGQVIFFTLMLAVVVVILALALAFPIKQGVDNARNETTENSIGLNCSTTSDDFVAGACVITDLYTPYFIVFLLGLAGAIFGAKLIFGGSA